MATQSFEQLIAGANKIKQNQLPESNTAGLVGEQLIQMVNKQKDEETERVKSMSEYNVSVMHPTGGIGGSEKYTFETAIRQIPNLLRRRAIKCAFYGTDGKSYVYEYQGGVYTDKANWLRVDGEEVHSQKQAVEGVKNQAILDIRNEFGLQRVTPEMLSESTKQLINASGGGSITNLADDEDLTSVGGVLKLADKAYNPAAHSGMGRKILRKNIVQGKNILTQEMINQPNTVYVIRYDFDLNGETIIVKDSSSLLFEGGTINNGILKACCIDAYKRASIFGDTITVDTPEVYMNWFKQKSDVDDTESFRRAVKLSDGLYKTIMVASGSYVVSGSIPVNGRAIIGESKAQDGVKIDFKTNIKNSPLFIIDHTSGKANNSFCRIENITAYGTRQNGEMKGICIHNDNTSFSLTLQVYNCNIRRFSCGIKVHCLIHSRISDTQIKSNDDGVILYKGIESIGTSTVFDNCYLQGNLRNVTVERESMIDLRFTNNTIFESSCYYNILIKGGLHFLLIDQCYFENNAFGKNYDGAEVPDIENVFGDIIRIESPSDLKYERHNTYVITNSIIAGVNGCIKLGCAVTINTGTLHMYNNRLTRFKHIINLISGYDTMGRRFDIHFNNPYFGGDDATVINDEGHILQANKDVVNVYYSRQGASISEAPPVDMTTYPSHHNFENAVFPGLDFQGMDAAMIVKRKGRVLAAFCEKGLAILGIPENQGMENALANSNALCLINGTDFSSRISNSSESINHLYLRGNTNVKGLNSAVLHLYDNKNQKWIKETVQTIRSCDSTERPEYPENGMQVYDNNLGKPIWWNANKLKWVDASGAGV